MSFVSVLYLLFIFLVTAVFYLLPARFRTFWLLLSGYIFYLSWQPAFIGVLAFVTLVAFLAGRWISSSSLETKKSKLIVSVIVLLLPLIFFKYFNALNDGISGMLSVYSLNAPMPNQPYLIPLGISFFTFQAISYVADIHRGYLKPEPRFVSFAAYIAFFPTLLAGPIERARSMLSQLNAPSDFDYQNIRAGLQLILWGVFKKVVIADRLAAVLDPIYAEPGGHHGFLIYLVLFLSVFEIFCDFSGYSDIAVGTARLFGIKLTKNFHDRVYAATSREMFWQGWHRSLTTWLRDYVFFPLSKGVKSQARLYVNVLIVYLLVGVWHGPVWGFIAWGLLNGAWLVVENATKPWREMIRERLKISESSRAFRFAAWLLVFHAGAVMGVFFRTKTPNDAISFLGNLGNPNLGFLQTPELFFIATTAGLILMMDLVNRRIPDGKNFDAFIGCRPTWFRWALYFVLAQMILRYIEFSENRMFHYFMF